MNSNQDRKTKAELQQELNQLRQELADTKRELHLKEAETKKMRRKVEEAKTDLKNLKTTCEDFREKQGALQAEVDQLRQTNVSLEEEKETLEKMMQEEEENASRRLAESNRSQRELERQQQHLKKENEELEKKLAEYEEKVSLTAHQEIMPEQISAAKSSFHINLYPRQGEFQGQIIHPLTQDKKVFSGLDKGAIVAFMSNHLPEMRENGEPLLQPTADVTPAASKAPQLGKPATTVETAQTQRFGELKTVPVGADQPTAFIPHEQPYAVILTLDLTDLALPKGAKVNQHVTVFARRLGSRDCQKIGEVNNLTEWTEKKEIRLDGVPLPPGQYKLQADVRFGLPDGGTLPRGNFIEGDVVHVL
ncbi:MAG: hypothetical protein ACE5HO_05675 [bacterium]